MWRAVVCLLLVANVGWSAVWNVKDRGVVRFGPGKYLTGTIELKSNITLELEAGAEIIGTADLDKYVGFQPTARRP